MNKLEALKILEVSEHDNLETIKTNYKNKAKILHPDLNPGIQSDEFKKLVLAYNILLGKTNSGNSENNFNKMSVDTYMDVAINLEQAYRGDEIAIRKETGCECDQCHGGGLIKLEEAYLCQKCQGEGAYRVSRGIIRTSVKCEPCKGIGILTDKICESCKGRGVLDKPVNITLKLPKNCLDKSVIKIDDEGYRGVTSKQSGDLFINITLKEHSVFKRRGLLDLLAVIKISVLEACLGGAIKFTTINGDIIDINISPETDCGKIIKVPNCGMVSEKDEKGDLYLKTMIIVPKGMNEKEKAVLRNLFSFK